MSGDLLGKFGEGDDIKNDLVYGDENLIWGDVEATMT